MFLLALPAAQTIQCNTVDTVGRTAPFAIEIGAAGDRLTLTIRELDPGAPTVAAIDVAPDKANDPRSALRFTVTIAGVIYAGKLDAAEPRTKDQRTLELSGTGDTDRGLLMVIGLCGDGFRPIRSPAQPRVEGKGLSCRAVTVSGRAFGFNYVAAEPRTPAVTATDKTLWQAGSAKLQAMLPAVPPARDGVRHHWAIFGPVEGTRGPSGYHIARISETTSRASVEVHFLAIEDNQTDGPANRAVALCEQLHLATNPS